LEGVVSSVARSNRLQTSERPTMNENKLIIKVTRKRERAAEKEDEDEDEDHHHHHLDRFHSSRCCCLLTAAL
jgi:hypothetical protein